MANAFVRKEWKNVLTYFALKEFVKELPETPEAKKNVKKLQDKHVHQLMKRAYEIPFYRERFDRCGLTPDDFHSAEDMYKFPIMTRADLRSWMDQVYREHPEQRKNWEIFKTSGSSGIPLRFMVSYEDHARVNANWIRVTMMGGHKPYTEKMLTFLTTHSDVDPKKGDSFVQKLGFLRRRIVPEHLYVGEGMRDLIELVNDYEPDMLCFRKNVLLRMASYAKQHDMQIFQPKVYTPVSEMVDDLTRKIFLETYGPGLLDAYGCNEIGSMAVMTPHHDDFYVLSDSHVVNIVDDDGNPADNGKVIATTLYKRDFPIINYEVGDRAETEVRDGLRYITRIMGRTNDMVEHANGTQTSAIEIMKMPNGITGILQFRYIQEDYDHIRILLVKDPAEDTATKEEIEAFYHKKFVELFGYEEFKLTFEWLDEIPPDENGKMRCFICNVKK